MSDDSSIKSGSDANSADRGGEEAGGMAVEANLLQFFSGMAAQALMHLGMMSNPLTGKTELDLPNAKYSIDLLTILEEKTKGNLAEDESRYLGAALYDLRMRYVEATGNADKTEDNAEKGDA